MKRIILFFIAGLAIGTTANAQTAADTLKMTLADCIENVIGNNYGRKEAKLNEDAKQAVYEQSKMERLPDFSATLSEGVGHTAGNAAAWNGNYDVNASVVLYQGGQISETIRQNRLSLQQSAYKTKQYDNDLVIRVLQTFLTAIGNDELLKYQQALLTASEEQLNQGRVRWQAGDILESDFLLLEAQWVNDKNSVATALINRNNTLIEMKNLLAMNLLQPLALIYPDNEAIEIMPALDIFMEKAVNTLPDFKISSYEVEIAETGLKIAKSAYCPTLSLGGSIGTGHSAFTGYGTQLSNRFNQQIGLTVSIPIYDKSRTKSNVQRSKIALQQTQLESKQTAQNLQQTLLTEYNNTTIACNQFETDKVRQNAYFKSFEAYRAKFNAGSITAVELLQQQNNYIHALNDYIRSKYGFMLKRKVLDVYMGTFAA
ncbi:MAG: TolC family protein [Bacteroidales bacterium]|jgi:outer membrane protein|nr:TolC family protein [Bacteroidales bacterium]